MLAGNLTYSDFAGYQPGTSVGNGFILWNLRGSSPDTLLEGVNVAGIFDDDRASIFGTVSPINVNLDQDSIFFGTQGVFMVVNEVTAVPIPAAAWLFGSALIGLIGLGRKYKTG